MMRLRPSIRSKPFLTSLNLRDSSWIQHCGRLGPVKMSNEKEIDDERTTSSQEAELQKVEDKCLDLPNVVLDHRARRAQLIARKDLYSSMPSEKPKAKSVDNAPDPTRHLESAVNKVESLEATLHKLQQERQKLEARTDLSKENKGLASRANKGRIDQLEKENNCLTLRNYSLNYNIRQRQI